MGLEYEIRNKAQEVDGKAKEGDGKASRTLGISRGSRRQKPPQQVAKTSTSPGTPKETASPHPAASDLSPRIGQDGFTSKPRPLKCDKGHSTIFAGPQRSVGNPLAMSAGGESPLGMTLKSQKFPGMKKPRQFNDDSLICRGFNRSG